jgi:hypothetical protein
LAVDSDKSEPVGIPDANQENQTNEVHITQLDRVPMEAPLSSTSTEDLISIIVIPQDLRVTNIGGPGVLCANGGVDTTNPKDCAGAGGPAPRGILPKAPLAFMGGKDGQWSLLIQRENELPVTIPACICGNGKPTLECPCTDAVRDEL